MYICALYITKDGFILQEAVFFPFEGKSMPEQNALVQGGKLQELTSLSFIKSYNLPMTHAKLLSVHLDDF